MSTPTYFQPSRVVGAMPVSNTVNTMVFTGAGVKTQNIPAGSQMVLIGVAPGMSVFMALNAAASVPTADITNGSGNIQNPAMVSLNIAGSGFATTISIATAAAGTVTLSFFS